MPGPAGQHTLILQQDRGYEKGNEGGPAPGFLSGVYIPCIASLPVPDCVCATRGTGVLPDERNLRCANNQAPDGSRR